MTDSLKIPMIDETLRIRKEITAKQEELLELRKAFPPQPVLDYDLKSWDGGIVKLSELFGDRDDLIVIHNMGRSCPYCTLWADGFNGLVHHLGNRAAFVVVSSDSPEDQREFAEGRGWRFRMASGQSSDFIKDMGFIDAEDGSYWPGVSTFKRLPDGSIQRIGADFFGPGDPYNAAWHLFDLLDGGAKDWHPRFTYDKQ